MLRRLLLIAVSCCLLIPVTAGADQANILNALIALNKAQERFSTPEQAEATAKEFFELVRTESGSDNAIAVLKELKRNVPQTEWRDGMRRAENSLMRVVQQTLDTTIVETVRQRTSSRSLGSIIGYGYSGKWPLKPETQLTFDGDFDASFFGIDLADTNPQRGIIAEVSQNLRARLGVEPTALGIVFSGFGWEAKADVYVTSAGKTWAIRQSMTRLYLIDTVTGAPIEITGYPDFLYYETQMQLLSKLHPEFFESGRLKSGVKQEQIRQTLMEDPRLGSTFKIWLADTRYTPGQAAAGVIDMTCHVAETAEATTPLEQRTKVAKQVARSNNIFLNAMDGAKLPWREFFSPEEIQFMRECASLDRAKITFAEAEAKRINFLLAQRAKGAATTEAELAQYQQLKVEAETARGELAIAERLVMDSAGSETSFIQRSVNIMHREAQIAHREFVIDLMGRPAAERAKLLADYEADLRALLDHYSKKPNVPPEAIEWAQGAYDSVKELSRVANENARALEGFGPKFMRLWEMFNAPVNSRENVRNMLGETPMGRSLLERIPEWAFANQRPPALTDIAFASPVKLVADLVVAPVNQTVNTLMMIDLMLQLSDVWSGNQTDVQKLVSCGEIVAMMVVPHLYLVPMVYQASLTGDPKQLAYVVACYICPPAMLPMLVDSLGTRVVSGAKRALFQSELEAMFQASTFDPADGQEPQDWETNRDGVTYTWVKLDTELDSYGRSGERSLATYIRILSSDTRQEIPLSQPKKMSGLQAIYLPGGVAKSFRAMIEDGDHRLFRENQALAEALSNLQKFNCDRLVPYMDKAPSYCRYAWAEQKSGIRLDLINNNFAEGEEARLQAEGKAGESMVKIVRSMLDQRAKLQNDVVDRLAEAIIISFEEEKRARKLVELGLIDDNLKELLEIGRELAIRDELKDAVSEALRKEGVKLSADQMDKTTGGMNDKARQDIAKVTDQWIKSYRYIADTRRSLVGLTGGYGVPKTEIDHFLRGKPPLQVIPGTDVQSTQTSREVIMNSPKDASGILFRLKGESREPNPMDSEAETTLLKYLFTARIMELTVDQPYTMIPLWQEGPAEDEKPEAFAERARGGLQNSLDMKNKSFWGSPPDFSAYLDRYYLLARGYAEKFAELRDRYRNDFQLAIEGSREVEAEKDVSLKVVPTRKGKPAGDALKDARIEWVVNQSVQNRGLTWWFSPLKEETINITVNAVRDVKGKPVILATATHQLVVKKKQEDTKPDDKKTDDKTKDSGQPVAATDPIDTAKLSFAGSAPDIWEGGNYDNGGERGFYMKRKKASSKGTGDCKWEAYVESTLWGKIDPTFGPGTEGEILSELNRQVEDAKAWGKTGQIRTVAIGDAKGHFMDTSVRFAGGGWSDAGFRGDGVSAEGRGYLIKGQRRIEVGYNVAGGGCWTNEDRPFLESQAHAAQDDAKAVLAGLQLVVNGTMTKTPYNGPKLDGSDMPKVTLSPPSVEKLKIGDTVNVQAVVENAKPENSPIGYNWGGTFDGKPEDMKTKASVKIKPSKPGKYTLSVSVDGAQFNLGSASLAYEVADYKVKLERIPADNKPVAMGGKVRLKALLTVDGKETTGNFIFRWQPNTEVTFSNNEVTPDPKLPRNETDAIFTKTGRIKIWVEVLDPRGSTSPTVATSDPIEVEAMQPKLKLSYEPKKPMTGQEVKITVQEEPKMPDETISFWWEIKGEAISPGPALNVPNSRAYSFKPKDTRPITVTVHAKAKDGGNELGSENITIEPQSYSVSISEPRYLESPPQVWRCDTQPGQAQHCAMVTLKPNEFAVFRDIFLKVTVTPQPESPRYKWTVDPSGSCGLPGAGSEIKLNCSSTGTYTAKVEVTNADAAKLGDASQPVAVSVSQRDLDGSKNAKDAYDKLQRAKEMVAQGKLDEGIPLVEEASKLDPKNTEASGLAAKWKKDRDEIKLHIARMDQLLKEDKIADAQKEFQPAQGVHPKYQPVVEAGKRLQGKQQEASQKQGQAQKLKAEGNALEAQGKLQEAINKYGESIRITPDGNVEAHIKQLESKLQQETQKKDTADKLWEEGMTLFNQKRMNEALAKFRESAKVTPNPQRADYVKKLEAEQSAAQKLNDEGAALQKQGKLPDAIARYKESIRHWPNPDLEKQIAALEDEARKKADQSRQDAQKKAAADNLWQEGMTLFNQKRMSEALAKFRESVKAAPNPQRADYVKKLEAEQSAAQKLNDEGAALQKQGKLPDAIARYKESIRHWPNADLEKQIAALEVDAKKRADQSKQDTQKKAAADKLWQEGTSLFNQGRPGEALAKFKESLNYLSSPERVKYVQDLEGRKTQAERLRNEGASLQNQGKLREAAGKYRESLGYWPDPALAGHIAKIEAEIKKQETQVVTQPTGSDASNASFPLQISRNVANQNSSAFKQNVRRDLSMDTTQWDKIPYSVHVSSHDLVITTPAKFCLAGDAGGTKGWSVDNFLLIEVLDQSGNLTSSALAGNTETVRRNGNPIETIGRTSFSFNACEIDITKLLPVGKPFRLRASAMDYGGVGYVSDVFIVSSKGTSGVVSQSPSPSPSAKGKVIFTNGNTGGVYNNPSRATTFTLREPHVITLVTNYHWNNGRGATPGTIALRGSDGRTYGSWRAAGSLGQGGVPNADWNAAPNVTLPAGTYTVVDSDPSTWAQNSESGGAGHTRVEGYPAGGAR